MIFAFTYGGIVEGNNDPLKLGRLKVRVPHVYGSSVTGTGFIGINDLPWALPAGMPAGASSASGGFSQLPEPGDSVWVRFLDGEPEKPIWEWGVQTTAGQESMALHGYGPGTPVGDPNRAILTRYGNSLEITENTVTLTTSEGYQVLLDGSQGETGGSAALQTPTGQGLTLNDLSKSVILQGLDAAVMSANTVILNAAATILLKASNSLSMMIGGTLIAISAKAVAVTTGTGASLLIDGNGNISISAASGAHASIDSTKIQMASPTGSSSVIIADNQISISGAAVSVNAGGMSVGADALWAAVMNTPSFTAWALGHTHISGESGSPTGPPIPIDANFPINSSSTRLLLI